MACRVRSPLKKIPYAYYTTFSCRECVFVLSEPNTPATRIFSEVTICANINDERSHTHTFSHIFFRTSSPRGVFTVDCTRMSRVFTDAHTHNTRLNTNNIYTCILYRYV